MSRRAARTDAHHAEIREALRKLGWLVADTSTVGRGFPDLVACRAGVVRLIEVKEPKGTLTTAQKRFCDVWPVAIVRSVDDVVTL